MEEKEGEGASKSPTSHVWRSLVAAINTSCLVDAVPQTPCGEEGVKEKEKRMEKWGEQEKEKETAEDNVLINVSCITLPNPNGE